MQLVERYHKVLREKAREVPLLDLGTVLIKDVLADMKKALHAEDDGVAIAAPQVGSALRIFIVSGKIFELKGRGGLDQLKEITEEKTKESAKEKTAKRHVKDIIFVNPRLIKSSKESDWMIEGCLSLRWLYGSVKRKKNVTVEAYDEKGVRFTRGAGGLLAQIFQHELDHLEGILFTDKARDVEDIPPELQKGNFETHAG